MNQTTGGLPMNEIIINIDELAANYVEAGCPFGVNYMAALIWWSFRCRTRMN